MTTWDATLYDESHNFVYKYGKGIVDILNVQPEEFVLDLGCGTGFLTNEIGTKCKSNIGIDASQEMNPKLRWNIQMYNLSVRMQLI